MAEDRTLAEMAAEAVDVALYTRFPPLLSMPKVASLLGKDVRTIKQWIRRGTFPLPTVQVGTRTLVRATDLERYLSEGKEVAV